MPIEASLQKQHGMFSSRLLGCQIAKSYGEWSILSAGQQAKALLTQCNDTLE